MQLKVNAKQRSDTNRRNRSPIVQITPYMRLGINRNYTLSVPTIDQDGDYFECRKMAFIEFIDLQTANKLKNIDIRKDCFIHIDTSSPEYQVGDSAVIAVTIQDFNRDNIKLAGDPHPLRQRYAIGRSLSAVPVQFYIEIVLKDDAPVIIDPTPLEQQMFTVFVGSILKLKVVAKPTNPTRTLSHFFFTRRDGVVPQTSVVTDETVIDPLAKSQSVLWTPVASDLGDHILCVRVEDSAGFDALPRCFIIRVKAAPVGVGSQIVQGKPAFLRFPSNGEISCLVGSSCRFPIYAVSTSPGGITDISLTSSEAAGCHVSAIRDASAIHIGAKMVDMTFQDSSFGRKKICLRAADANSVIMKCFEAVVQPKDPCEVQPCRNSAECVTNGDRTSYVCICPPGYTGIACDIAPDKCNPNPCKFGGICIPHGIQVECRCTSGFFGTYCENAVDKCRPDPCGKHGVCEETPTGYTCHCQDGYSGNSCTGPVSPPVNACNLNPRAVGCNCGAQCVAPNGICVGAPGSGTCLCSKGFTGPDCQSQSSLGGQDPIFVPPTPEAEDLIKCEQNSYLSTTCIFAVYTSPDTGMSTAPLVKTILPPSKVRISVSPAADPKIPGILNIYRFDIKIQAQPKAAPKLHVCLQVAKSSDSTHPTDTKCFNVEYVFKHGIDPWGTSISPAPANTFVDPTLPDQSEIVCEIGKPCHFFVFASKVASICKHVLASDTVSTAVFDPSDVGTSCMTNIVCDFKSSAIAGTRKKICLKSGDLGDVRCFYLRSVTSIVDHCASSPCKNGGVCGSTQGTYVCTCTAGFTGQSCEKGPCPPTVPPHCNNGGYCYSIGATRNCFCKLGFSGQTCADNSKDTVVNPQANGAKFKDGTIPKEVKCYVGQPCQIPTTLIGDPGTRPVVSPGYVNGNLDVHGTTVTKDPSSPTDYHTSVEVVSKTSGKHQICIQSNNPAGQSADEICFMVNAVNGQLNLPSKSHAYFIDPSLPDGSSVECKTGKACHLSLWVHNYDGEDACPSVKSSQDIYSGVYIHQATGTSASGPCKVDVVFHNDQPKTYTGICFTSTSSRQDVFGGDGEVRCYDVTIVDTLSVVGSCSSTLCENGAFCDGHRTTPKCACLSGFSGPLCHQTHGESLTSPAPVPGVTQSTFGDLAVPKEIKCTLHQECEVPFTFTKPGGGTGTQPSLNLGQIDSGLTVTPAIVSKDPHSPEGTYQGKVKVVGNTPGNKKVCVHTPTSSPDVVGDDICFNVDVTNPTGSSAAPNVAQPHFIEPTVQPQSTLQCEPGRICHVILQMSPGINHGCPSVVQAQGPSDDLHLFHSDSNTVIGSCAVDVTLTPPASKHGTDTLCFDTSLPYIPGEHRCFKVDYSHIVSGPCTGITCHNGGVCGANGQCVCPIDRSGPNCENSGNQGPAHTAVPPKFTDMALPTDVKCEINTECVIPLMVNGAQATL
ncbi:neurogenic locus notch homolog protein 2-like [Mizuhopecten yessoensis]|nr:neurogenic locus notch homolog protein 2-like [Mizuhopecten yessoensis]